jgi:rare lipoprotein A (peptidoglycan hydrolase)
MLPHAWDSSIEDFSSPLHTRVVQRLFGALVLLSFPFAAFAQDAPLSRRDGFLLMWNTVSRVAYDVIEKDFLDVGESDIGYKEILYAKDRGILDDTESFSPDEPLTLRQALMWLYRTRNVDELPDMQDEHLSAMIAKYPVVSQEEDLTVAISRSRVEALIVDLDKMLDEEVHEVSLYSEKFHGDGTAFGESFDMHALTAAHRSYPHNTLVKVTNVENNQSVTVRINDRGPFVEGRDMDLSLAAFTTIAERSKGVINARFERLGDVSLVRENSESVIEETDETPENIGECPGTESRYQKRLTRDVRFHRGVPHAFGIGGTLTLGANRFFVLRRITYPDGKSVHMQDWVSPDEHYSFKPGILGSYRFLIGTTEGRTRELTMQVQECLE